MMVNFNYTCWKWQFFNKNISQGSVATRLRCGGIFNSHCAANLPLSMSVKEFWKSVKKWQSYGHEFGVFFFGTQCITTVTHQSEGGNMIGRHTEMSWYNSPIRIVEWKLNVVKSPSICRNENIQQQHNSQMRLFTPNTVYKTIVYRPTYAICYYTALNSK